MNPPICRRCLLRDLDDASYARTVEEYIAAIPSGQKAPAEEYEKRLSLCRQCDRLVSGMCSLCGCFVEARAAKSSQHCPDTPSKW